MKRFFTILGSALFLVASIGFAQNTNTLNNTALLIDFNQLALAEGAEVHEPTSINFAGQVIPTSVERDSEELQASLAIQEWRVELVSSSNTVENSSLSLVRQAPATDADGGEVTVMGFRVHFPDFAANSYAKIVPPFNIPAYQPAEEQDGQGETAYQFDGFGVIRNVATIKEIRVETLGRQFPHTMYLIIEDETGEETFIRMGNLEFNGWRNLIWQNPNYQADVTQRRLELSPLYPQNEPFIKLNGILIHRDAADVGGDFVGYVKEIEVIYDVASLNRTQLVNDEAIWGIRDAAERAQRNAELARLGNRTALEALERDRQAAESFDPVTGNVVSPDEATE